MDSFERTAIAVLHDTLRANKAEKLFKLRRQHQDRLRQIDEAIEAGRMAAPSATEFNIVNNQFLRQAEELLGPDDFQKIFGIPAGQVANIVDQQILDSLNR